MPARHSIVAFEQSSHWRRSVDYSDGCWEEVTAKVPLGYTVSSDEARSFFNGLGKGCSRCFAPLETVYSERDRILKGSSRIDTEDFAMRCVSCGWWYTEFRRNEDPSWDNLCSDVYQYDRDVFEAIEVRYDLASMGVPMHLLREHLADHVEDLRFLNPRKFELLLRDLYRDFFSCEVRHVGGPGDNGVDLYAIISDEPHLVQAKRRASGGHVESVRTVREFVGTIIAQGARSGHVVTTASRFSPQAENLARSPNLRRYAIRIDLKTKSDIYEMLSLTRDKSRMPWLACEPSQVADLSEKHLRLRVTGTSGQPQEINEVVTG